MKSLEAEKRDKVIVAPLDRAEEVVTTFLHNNRNQSFESVMSMNGNLALLPAMIKFFKDMLSNFFRTKKEVDSKG